MNAFKDQLDKLQPDKRSNRRWVYVPYDQLTDQAGPLAETAPQKLGIVIVENRWKARRRPYHQHKLALVLANQRHFALEQARRGVAVEHVAADSPWSDALRPSCDQYGALTMMRPAEWELRSALAPLREEGLVKEVPHSGWLTSRQQFLDGAGDSPPWRMDRFYQHLRRDSGILMEGGSPMGGRYSLDGENRDPWKGEPAAPEQPIFEHDDVTCEVLELVETEFADHPGRIDADHLPATRADAETLWAWAREQCMTHFGPYEDAMTTQSSGLFHTRISGLINIHRLLPARVLSDVLDLDIPLNSKEGFVRQLFGWREFMRHVHEETDGFRRIPEGTSTRSTPGDGGFARWSGEDWETSTDTEVDGGAEPNHLESKTPLPPAWWGKPSGLHCLDRVVNDVWKESYSHHITRLMILSNLATLLDVHPRELTDWFWVAYQDAYDWVVEPNVLAMGTFATGPLMTTKPYVSGAAYINRMSDYCGQCAFNPRKNCPVTHLYWAFLARHRQQLDGNRRMGLPLKNLERRSEEKKATDRSVHQIVIGTLSAGGKLTPESFQE